MMNKKAQSQIITTVLIILLVLAAIVIVWQVVRSTVETGAGSIGGATECVTVDLDVTAVTADSVTVQRKAGGIVGNVTVSVVVAGELQTDTGTGLLALESETIDFNLGTTLSTGEKVEVAAILPGGTVCDISGEATL